MHYENINEVEEVVDGRSYIRRGINGGDTTEFGAWLIVIDPRAIECDCGKGAYCPFNTQVRK